jgi:hypothetical protein
VKIPPALQIQASLRDAGQVVTEPGDKSPGYCHLSLRDVCIFLVERYSEEIHQRSGDTRRINSAVRNASRFPLFVGRFRRIIQRPLRSASHMARRASFHFVPEGHAIVARRFIAGLAINRICVPEGRLKLDLGPLPIRRAG